LTWPQVTGNNGYQVDRSLDNVTWTNNVGSVGTDVTTFPNNTGLSAGTLYYYRVSANSSGGFSATSDPQSTYTTPDPPVVTSTVISSSQIDLSWPLKFGATVYYVDQIGLGPIGTVTKSYSQSYCGYPVPRLGCTSLTTDSTGKSATGLTNGTNYCFQVRAWNSGGFSTASTPQTCATTSAISAQNLRAAALDGGFKIKLDWDPIVCSPTACATPGYELQRQVWDDNWVLLKMINNGTTLTYTDTIAIDPKNQYRYRVRSVNGADKSPFSEVTISARPYSAEANVCTEN
jgi:large repetitive protein